MGQAKFALAAMSCLVLIAHSAAAKLTIDGFEDGAVMFADIGRVGAGPVETEPYGTETSRERAGLDEVSGGVRLLTLGASEAITAALVPIQGADNALLLSWVSYGTATLTYDGIAGGLAASGSAGALDLDLRAFDSIVVEVSSVDIGTGGPFNLSVSLSDSVRTAGLGQPIQRGANTFRLADFDVDLAHIRQVQLRLAKLAGGAASVRVLDISAVSNPSPGSGLPAPTALAPANGGTAPTQGAAFSWTPVQGATGYRIAAATESSALPDDPAQSTCTGCHILTTTAVPIYVHVGPALPASTVHWWRVQALPAGRWSEAAVFSTQGSVVLQITSPVAGSTIEANSFIVKGLVTPPPSFELAVEVNGVVSIHGPAKFAATVPIGSPRTILTATARDATGAIVARQAIPIAVNTPAEEPAISLSVAPDMGTAPFTAHFALVNEVSLTLITLDADGNGTPDYAGHDFEDVSFTYAAPGLYEPTVTILTGDGTTYSASTLVRVFTSAELDLLLKPKWTALKNALRSGSITNALQQVLTRRRAQYTSVLQSLTIPLSGIDSELTELIIFDAQLGRNVTYQMLRVENGTTYSYPVVFTLDDDGIWRLGAF